MPYDRDNGLVFQETTVSTRCGNGCLQNPLNTCRGSKPRYTSLKKGAHPLVTIVKRQLLCNLDLLTVDALEVLPDHYLEEIWAAVQKSELDSFATWRLFASTNRLQTSMSLRAISIGCARCSALDLAISLRLLTCSKMEWVTHLTLGNIELTTRELMSVSCIQNLTRLALQPLKGSWDCSLATILRAWAHSAREENAFSCLEMILIGPHAETTKWCFTHISAFPLLQTLVIAGMLKAEDTLQEASRQGWVFVDLDAFYKDKRRGNQSHLTHNLGQPWETTFDSFMKSTAATEGKPPIPVLHASLAWKSKFHSESTRIGVRYMERRSSTSLPEEPKRFERNQGRVKCSEPNVNSIKRRKLRDGKTGVTLDEFVNMH